MSYLEELLPEFRKGARIRLSTWPENQYIYKKGKEIYNEDGEISKFLDNYVMTCDLWEFYQEPIDWDYIIKNKCLCWFWDEGKARRIANFLKSTRIKKPKFFDNSGIMWDNCCPVCKDEITFYEDRDK